VALIYTTLTSSHWRAVYKPCKNQGQASWFNIQGKMKTNGQTDGRGRISAETLFASIGI